MRPARLRDPFDFLTFGRVPVIFWTLIFFVVLVAVLGAYALWRRGYTIQELVHDPPREVDLPQFVTTLGYLHHELIKHRLPLVRTVADQPHEQVEAADVDMLKQAVTGARGRPRVDAAARRARPSAECDD